MYPDAKPFWNWFSIEEVFQKKNLSPDINGFRNYWKFFLTALAIPRFAVEILNRDRD